MIFKLPLDMINGPTDFGAWLDPEFINHDVMIPGVENHGDLGMSLDVPFSLKADMLLLLPFLPQLPTPTTLTTLIQHLSRQPPTTPATLLLIATATTLQSTLTTTIIFDSSKMVLPWDNSSSPKGSEKVVLPLKIFSQEPIIQPFHPIWEEL